ncbi:MAG: GNAT family N-acetyltransferase, partial [Chloroflexi bacterium]|nr:GNAT family N-acetyltransferase [Chloroflexota bacterium]
GCAIARDYWGKGYAFEASRYLMAYALDTLPIHRIYAETISENKRARVLAEGLGMQLEGELRHNRYFQDRWWNTVIYAVLKE